MMLAARNVALRVNGSRVTRARVLVREKGPHFIVTDPILGEFAVNDRSTLELLELLHPPEMRLRLPNGGWRKVTLRILIALVRGGVVRVAEES
jgi:hypothetical protein